MKCTGVTVINSGCAYDKVNNIFSWNGTGNNTAQLFQFNAGTLSKFTKLHITCDVKTEGGNFRVLIGDGSNWKTIYYGAETKNIDIIFASDLSEGQLLGATEIRIAGNSEVSAAQIENGITEHKMELLPSNVYLEANKELPFTIATFADWTDFADYVAAGVTNLNAQMTSDVIITDNTMVGSSSKPYTGTFDGDGYKLNVDYTSTEPCAAPFCYVKDATIKNLVVDGKISSSSTNIAGVVGQMDGTTVIDNCQSSVAITSTQTSGDSNSAGIAGINIAGSTITVSNCLFDGSIKANGASAYCGIIGYLRSGTLTVINNLVLGTLEGAANTNLDNIVRNYAGVELSSNYYKNKFGTSSQGNQATAEMLASGEVTYNLQGKQATLYWGQNLEEQSSIPMLTNNAAYKVFDLGGGEYANWDYTINDDADWIKFSKIVETGTTDVDVTMTADVNAGSTMVGVDADNKRYSGTFDGAGHTLTFNYDGGGQFVAPFSCIEGATIKDLLTTGSIKTSSNMPGGIVGKNVGNSTLTRCGSNMTLTSTDSENGRIGGLVGRCADGNQMTFNNCLYNGAISTASSEYACGFVGWDNQAEKITLNNCLVAATSITGGNQNFINNAPVIPDGKYALYISKFGSSDQGTQINEAQRYSGYVAYTLSSDITEGTLFFGQGNLNSSLVDNAPALTSNTSKKVVGKTPEYTGTMVYMNPGGAVPNAVRLKALGWYFDGTQSHVTTTVPVDINNETVLRRSKEYFKLAVGAAGATTLAVPFSTTSLPDGVKAYDLTIEDAAVKATRVYKITANKPVLINAPQGEYLFSAETTGLQDIEMETGENAWINYAALSDPINGALTGVYNCKSGDYSAVSFVPQNKYVLQNGGSGIGFYKVDDAENPIKITSFRAYLTADIDARSLEIVFDEDPTGIDNVTAKKAEENGAYFNLAGQRVAQPTKGLYIVNGKKVIKK